MECQFQANDDKDERCVECFQLVIVRLKLKLHRLKPDGIQSDIASY